MIGYRNSAASRPRKSTTGEITDYTCHVFAMVVGNAECRSFALKFGLPVFKLRQYRWGSGVGIVRRFARWRLEPGSNEAYAFAIGCVAVATALRWGLGLISDDILPFPTYYPAVLFAALIGGTYAGTLAATLGGLIAWWAFVAPQYAFLPLNAGSGISLVLYFIGTALIIWSANHYATVAARLEAEEELRKLAVEELSHRLKNKVATIQAIISSRLRDYPKARDTVIDMLASLSATDDLIISTQGEGAFIKDIIKAEVGPYDSSRVSMQGPGVLLPQKLAITMALVVHELATNAAKYGALASPTGRLHIVWSVKASQMVIRWQESGGPLVTSSNHQGFGSRLLDRALMPFDGNIERRFEPDGLICEMTLNIRTAQGLEETIQPAPPVTGDKVGSPL